MSFQEMRTKLEVFIYPEYYPMQFFCGHFLEDQFDGLREEGMEVMGEETKFFHLVLEINQAFLICLN